jgi:hypothetical protein
MSVPERPFQPILKFVGNAGAYPISSWPYYRTLEIAGKACHGQALDLITKVINYGCKKIITMDAGPNGQRQLIMAMFLAE